MQKSHYNEHTYKVGKMKKLLLVGAMISLSIPTAYANSNFEKWTVFTPQIEQNRIFDVIERVFSKKDQLVYEKSLDTPPDTDKVYIGSKGSYSFDSSKTHPDYGVAIDVYSDLTDKVWSLAPYNKKAIGDISMVFELSTHDISGKPIVKISDTSRYSLKKMNILGVENFTDAEKKWLNNSSVFPQGSKCVRFENYIIHSPYLEYDKASERNFSLNEISNLFSPPRKIGNSTYYLNLEDEESSLVKIGDKLYDGTYIEEGNYYSRQDELSMIDESINDATANNDLNSVPLYQAQQDELQLSCNAYNEIASNAIHKALK